MVMLNRKNLIKTPEKIRILNFLILIKGQNTFSYKLISDLLSTCKLNKQDD